MTRNKRAAGKVSCIYIYMLIHGFLRWEIFALYSRLRSGAIPSGFGALCEAGKLKGEIYVYIISKMFDPQSRFDWLIKGQ